MGFTDFNEQNIAPYSASKIGVYDDEGKRVGYVPLGNFKPTYGERLYRFGIISDTHDGNNGYEATEDLQHALEYFNNKESVDFTCVCGDLSDKGFQDDASSIKNYKENVDAKSPNTTVYSIAGNHDRYNSTEYPIDDEKWESIIGYPKNFEITKGTDHFLFMGCSKKDGGYYTEDDVVWLAEKLESYKLERSFIMMHVFFRDACGNFKGLFLKDGPYNGLDQNKTIEEALTALRWEYPNAIWFSGHTHFKWYLQKYVKDTNVKLMDNGTWTVHIPSCAIPVGSNADNTKRVQCPLESEGAIVDVYENYIDIRAMDLKNNLYIPIAQYRLDTTIKTDIPHDDYYEVESYSKKTNIATDYKANNTFRVKYKFAFNEGCTEGYVFGERYSMAVGKLNGVFDAIYGTQTYTISDAIDNDVHEIDFNKNVLSIDGNIIHEFTEEVFAPKKNIALWGMLSSSHTYKADITFYSCEVYENDVLVHDYKVKRKGYNTYMIYDSVTDTYISI